MKTAMRLVERGLVPEALLRYGIQRLLRQRLREQQALFDQDHERALRAWVESMRRAPVALVPEKANEQHYEVPPAFFQLVLGQRLKYSSGYYSSASATLDEAEEAMLALSAERAGLQDGQDVLELGCGWGSLTLWMAESYATSRIVAVSNSAPQRAYIQAEARRRGLDNVSVVTRDMNDFTIGERFDRVVSVEMFEHMRNWEELMRRVAGWLRPDGRFFLHVFAHQRYAYPFEARDESDWMSRHFFSGGMMPCHDLVERLELPLESEARWVVPGTHYARTSEGWLQNLEQQREAVLALFGRTYGTRQAELWYQRWRVFFLACAELFGYRGGSEWIVSHHLLRPRRTAAVSA
ncbi:MAG: class I SAM-dependent methyltransferase [Planctomycetes bacterium]|nr:class I SAM-dependent methyltransferase [Planctomycetota bacterium]